MNLTEVQALGEIMNLTKAQTIVKKLRDIYACLLVEHDRFVGQARGSTGYCPLPPTIYDCTRAALILESEIENLQASIVELKMEDPPTPDLDRIKSKFHLED